MFAVDPAGQFRTPEIRGDVTIEPDPDFVTLGKVLAATRSVRVVATHKLNVIASAGMDQNDLYLTS